MATTASRYLIGNIQLLVSAPVLTESWIRGLHATQTSVVLMSKTVLSSFDSWTTYVLNTRKI